MLGLLEVLSVEGGAETKSDTSAELDVVGESRDTFVVDFGLHEPLTLNDCVP